MFDFLIVLLSVVILCFAVLKYGVWAGWYKLKEAKVKLDENNREIN